MSLDSIDGPGNLLGTAGPCYTRNANGLPIVGFMLWQNLGLLSGAGSGDPYFTGASGRQGFVKVGGNAYVGNVVPVENVGGAATVGSHWRESVLNTELMTGYTSPPGVRMPLSLVTIGSLEDLGYVITPWGYDVFTFGADLRSSVEATGTPLRELTPAHAPIGVDDNGPVELSIRASRRLDLARKAPRQLEIVSRR